MKIDKYTEVTREPVLNYSDSMFFGGFGFILSFFYFLVNLSFPVRWIEVF